MLLFGVRPPLLASSARACRRSPISGAGMSACDVLLLRISDDNNPR
jgi:hypothetical protein